MVIAFFISMFMCFILFIWNLFLIDENLALHFLLKEYSYQIEQDAILLNERLIDDD